MSENPENNPIIVDAHQDLAWNMLTFERDYTRSAADTRHFERFSFAPVQNGETLLGWPDYQRGRVAIVFSTLFAAPARLSLGEWDTQCYHNAEEAHQRYRAQLDAYHRLVDTHPEKFRLLQTRRDLDEHLTQWQTPPGDTAPPVGFVILMECAEGVRSVDELEMWWARGVRFIGPAWAGTRFCGGTREPGPLTPEGFQLLEGMASYGFALDLSHMDEKAVWQALDRYPGTIIASHANASALLKGLDSNRFLSDQVIEGLLERQGIIGVVPFNRFLLPGWTAKDGRHLVTLEHVVAQIDHICQLAGDALHVGLGSDFDGGFGIQSVPEEIDTIADLQKLVPLLAQKGYTETDIAAILGQNWLRVLQNILPESV
ncbi:MAG TPA: peptidase M19 [Chloroflexi bacterium]|nr:peptidase M19 [Chloroflexota bacterium]